MMSGETRDAAHFIKLHLASVCRVGFKAFGLGFGGFGFLGLRFRVLGVWFRVPSLWYVRVACSLLKLTDRRCGPTSHERNSQAWPWLMLASTSTTLRPACRRRLGQRHLRKTPHPAFACRSKCRSREPPSDEATENRSQEG